MKYIVLVIGLLFFGGCAPRFANVNVIKSEFKNMPFPSPKGLYAYYIPKYKINYPIYSSKLHIYGYVVLYHNSKPVLRLNAKYYTEATSKIEKGYIQKYQETVFENSDKSTLTYVSYKVNPDIRDIYDFKVGGDMPFTKAELENIKKQTINNENFIINIVKYGVSRGETIQEITVSLSNIKITFIKKIDGIYRYKGKKVIVTYDTNKNGNIECGGYSYLDYNTLQTLYINDVCYGVINYKNRNLGFKTTIIGES